MPRYQIERFDRKPMFGRRQYYFRLRELISTNIIMSSEGVNNKDDRNNTSAHLAGALKCRIVDVP
jgi:hypothetical protein